MSNEQFLVGHSDFIKRVQRLKAKSCLYPEIVIEREGNTVQGTCLVEFIYKGAVYHRHCVESVFITPTCTEADMVRRIHIVAGLIKEKAIPCEYDEKIGPATEDIDHEDVTP